MTKNTNFLKTILTKKIDDPIDKKDLYSDHHLSDVNIKIIAVGGFGCKIIRMLSKEFLSSVSFIIADGKYEIDYHKDKFKCIQLHPGGLDGGSVSHNEEYAKTAESKFREALEGADILFICAGLGGGAGTGASPVIARIARDLRIPSVAIITMPALFEGSRRVKNAEAGFKKLDLIVNASATISSEEVLCELDENCEIDDLRHKIMEISSKFITGLIDEVNMTDLSNINCTGLHDALLRQVGKFSVIPVVRFE